MYVVQQLRNSLILTWWIRNERGIYGQVSFHFTATTSWLKIQFFRWYDTIVSLFRKGHQWYFDHSQKVIPC